MLKIEVVNIDGDRGKRWQEGGLCRYRVEAYIGWRLLWRGDVEHNRKQGWPILLIHIAYAAATGKGQSFEQFCRQCGAGIGKFRRIGEATCPECPND